MLVLMAPRCTALKMLLTMPQRIWALLLLLLVAAGLILPTWCSSLLSSSMLKHSNAKQKQQFVKTFEKRLLGMFGLAERPKPKRNVTVSDYMWELYKKQNKLNKGLHGSPTNTIRCFKSIEQDGSDARKASYVFDIADIPKHEDVWAAELVVYRRRPDSRTSNNLERIRVFDVLNARGSTSASKDDSDAILRLLDTRVLRNSKKKSAVWESFDVLPTVRRWRKEPSVNHGLVVELSTNASTSHHHHVRLKREAHESLEQWSEFQPMLVTYSRDTSRTISRTRRNTRKHRRKGRKSNCARHTLYVDFSDVGWNDWIVAPPGYNAYYCHGDCPFPLADHLNSTNHAIVQTLVNSVNPAAVPRACCVPTELSPISMLYVDEYDKVVLKNYQDMVVEGCGCR